MVAKGFDGVDGRFDTVGSRLDVIDGRLDSVEEKIKEVHEDVKSARRDLLDIGDRFVPRYEFDNLLIRFSRLEQKVIGKSRK